MSVTSLDRTAHLALQFVGNTTSIIDSLDDVGAKLSHQSLREISDRLRLDMTAGHESWQEWDDDDQGKACLVGRPDEQERALHPLLQGISERFSAWTSTRMESSVSDLHHDADVALFNACIRLLDCRLKTADSHRFESTTHDTCGELLSAALEGYHAMSHEAQLTAEKLADTQATLTASNKLKSEILTDFDRARKNWRRQLDSRSMGLEERDARMRSQAEEIISLRSEVASLSGRLDHAHQALAIVCSSLLAHAVEVVGEWCSLHGST